MGTDPGHGILPGVEPCNFRRGDGLFFHGSNYKPEWRSCNLGHRDKVALYHHLWIRIHHDSIEWKPAFGPSSPRRSFPCAMEGGETHFEVDIRAPSLEGLSRIDAHRRVNDALAEELATGLHALQIRILR
jgi:stress-induced morphogen